MSVQQYDETSDLSQVFVGRKIVKAEKVDDIRHPSGIGYWGATEPTGVLTLDDGTVVYVAGNDGGCACSAGCYYLQHVAEVDNIITAVKVVDESVGDDSMEDGRWQLFVVADNRQINVAEFVGTDGNGYYGTGFHVAVVPPKC